LALLKPVIAVSKSATCRRVSSIGFDLKALTWTTSSFKSKGEINYATQQWPANLAGGRILGQALNNHGVVLRF
jgi:hypothetical protein